MECNDNAPTSNAKVDYSFLEKIVILGDDKVGKSLLISRLASSEIKHEDSVENKAKITFENKKENYFQFFEMNTINPEIISALSFLCQCIILLFDKSTPSSFIKTQEIYNILLSNRTTNYFINIFLISNKNDIPSNGSINESEIHNFLNSNSNIDNIKFYYFKISALTQLNIANLKFRIQSVFNEQRLISNQIPKSIIYPSYEDIDILNVFKVLLLGDSTVGKTSFISRFFLNYFTFSFTSTIGMGEMTKNVVIHKNIYKLQIWDTAGQERFRALPESFYSKVDGIILIYDVSNERTFNNIGNWLKVIKRKAGDNIHIYLVGNKIDLKDKRVIPSKVGKSFADANKIKFTEISCCWDLNVSDLTYDLLYDIYKSVNQEIKGGDNLKLQNNNRVKICCS